MIFIKIIGRGNKRYAPYGTYGTVCEKCAQTTQKKQKNSLSTYLASK